MSETSKDYLSKYSGEQVEARLGRCNLVPTLDHVPGAEDLSFVDAEGTHTFLVGDECRYLDTEKEAYRFYKLNDITSDGKAEWFLVRGVEAGDELSKDAIEQALTGNITTHRHDTTYQETTFETDVWDGSSISSSLQGSGTKDDPYLIQSCADWLHVYLKADQYAIYNVDNYTAATEFKPVFKLMKNLDFGSKDIDVSSLEGIGSTIVPMCEFDGNHAKISNFKAPVIDKTQFGVFSPFLVFTFCHDFILDNIEIEINEKNTTGITLWGTPGQDLTFSAALNNIIDLKVAFRGNIPTEAGRISIPIVLENGYFYTAQVTPKINQVIDNYIQENGRFCGCSAVGVDGVDSGWELKADLIFESPYDTYKQAPVIYCSNSLSEIELPIQDTPTFVGNRNVNVSYLIIGQEPAKFYSNSDGSDKIAIQNLEGETTTFTTTPKSLTEMQSESFVEELNSLLPKPAFKKDPEGGTPILAQYGAIEYDGYVKQSEFESLKKNINVEEPPAVIDSLSSESTTDALSANMGKKLNDEKVGSSEIRTIKKLTQSSYDGLSSKDSETLYVIVG